MVGEGVHGGVGLRLLLDTHAVYWAVTQPGRLSDGARAEVEDPANDVFVSAASIYEIIFKVAIRKLKLAADLTTELVEAGFAQLPLTWQHAQTAGSLPLHHRDPWDRLLVAQSQLEGLTVVTRDSIFADYGVPVLAA